MPRACDNCGAPLVQRVNEKPGRFAARRLCSRRCAAAVASVRASELSPERRSAVMREGPYLVEHDGKGGKVRQHRAVMERHLGRKLRPGEVVHHTNGDGHDNRIENLLLLSSQGEHMRVEWEAGTPLFGHKRAVQGEKR